MHVCMRHIHVLLALCFLPQGWSQTAPEQQSLSLDQCITMALQRHPLILASGEWYEAALARIRQATVYPFPSIGFNSDLQPQPFNFFQSEEGYLGIDQTFELPRKRKVRGEIMERESREIGTEIEVVRLEVIFQVRRAFYALLLAQEKVAYARQDLELAEDYLKKAEFKLAAGDVGNVEVLRARVEALRAANALRTATNDEELAKAQLNYHLAQGRSAPIQIRGQLQIPFVDLDLAELYAEALRLRPELQRLNFAVEKEGLVQESARLSNIPDLDFNLSLHQLEGLPTTWSFNVSLPLPFLFQQRQKAEIAESQANSRALQREAEQVSNTILAEVQEARVYAQNAQDQIRLYQDEILPQAQEVVRMFDLSYQEGEIGGIELIEARRTLNESRKAYADALFEYAQALASLEKAVGRRP
jgi:cobalt-zinc-cadmium efflux system outer membrane protein